MKKIRSDDFITGAGISVYGQFRLVLSIVNKETGETKDNFIDVDCFEFLSLDEIAGFRLPMMRMGFKVYSDSVLAWFNQGNVVRIYVTSQDCYKSTVEEPPGIKGDYVIMKPEIYQDGNVKKILLTCIQDSVGFIDDRRLRSFREMTSKTAFKKMAEQYFSVDLGDDTEEPLDKQTWVQASITDKDFCKQLFLYSNYPESFPVIGITSEGKFKHRNFAYIAKGDPKWTISYSNVPKTEGTLTEGISDTEIIHNGDIKDISNAGILNLWRGAGVIVPVYNIDSGGAPTYYESTVPPGLLSGSTSPNIRKNATPTFLPLQYENSNTYAGFAESKSRNLYGATTYSSQVVQLTTAFPFGLIPIEILDLVYLKDPASAEVGEGGKELPINMFTSGKYIVSRVSRKITTNGIEHRIEMSRESLSNQIGAFKQ